MKVRISIEISPSLLRSNSFEIPHPAEFIQGFPDYLSEDNLSDYRIPMSVAISRTVENKVIDLHFYCKRGKWYVQNKDVFYKLEDFKVIYGISGDVC